jgi:ATP-grasp domain
MSAPVFLIVDPFHDYALRFIDVVRERFGVAPLCVMTEPRTATGLREYPRLRDFERVRIHRGQLANFAHRLSAQREVLGVIPFSEQVLAPSIELLDGLRSAWNEPQVLAILRDKSAIKQLLREAQPSLKVDMSQLIPAGERQLEVKPNDGFGNGEVGYFSHLTPSEPINEFLRSCRNTDMVLEEYHAGPEYFLNAQVDHRGECTALAAFRYERVWANGRQVDWLTRKVAHHSAEFELFAQYAQSVVAAVGLRRCPIHLEVKMDDGVPRLVELGARLAGNRNAFLCNRLHGNRIDLFALAAHYYLRDEGCQPLQLDWHTYNAADVLYVHGVSFEKGYIHRLEGVDAIERHPFFGGWVTKPEVGQRLWRTVDLFTAPFCFLLQSSKGQTDLAAAAQELRQVLRINKPPAPLRNASVTLSGLFRRACDGFQRLTDFS